jgi:hypothetical protein
MEELWKMDPEILQSLFDQHQRDLNTALLEGAEWKDVQEKRKLVTELSIVLFHRTVSSNPAEFNTRNLSSDNH